MEFVTENLIHSSRIRYQSAWTGVSVRPGHNVSGSDTPPPKQRKSDSYLSLTYTRVTVKNQQLAHRAATLLVRHEFTGER
jgi:hypothetical protein